eukprot:1162058-Pelagomonas_calceolata.AAC.4
MGNCILFPCLTQQTYLLLLVLCFINRNHHNLLPGWLLHEAESPQASSLARLHRYIRLQGQLMFQASRSCTPGLTSLRDAPACSCKHYAEGLSPLL